MISGETVAPVVTGVHDSIAKSRAVPARHFQLGIINFPRLNVALQDGTKARRPGTDRCQSPGWFHRHKTDAAPRTTGSSFHNNSGREC